jgi:uncharacterized RDD family membrane protein YckC
MQSPPPPPQPPMGGYMPAPGYAPSARYGGFWIRVVAYIIDAVIIGIVAGIIDAILHINLTDPQNPNYGSGSGVNLVLSFAYFVGMWSTQGATLGQRIFKLKVVDANTSQPISFGKSALRWVGLLVSFLVCFVGIIWVAFDARKQGWMDKIAGTLVVQG